MTDDGLLELLRTTLLEHNIGTPAIKEHQLNFMRYAQDAKAMGMEYVVATSDEDILMMVEGTEVDRLPMTRLSQ